MDNANCTVWLGKLLKFYPQDLVPASAPSLIACALASAPLKTVPRDIADYSVRFTPHDLTPADMRCPKTRPQSAGNIGSRSSRKIRHSVAQRRSAVSACVQSAIKSSTASKPNEKRTKVPRQVLSLRRALMS